MKKTSYLEAFILAMIILPKAISADLMDIYHQALDSDPAFKGAYSTFMSNAEAIPQAQAALLPQLTLGGSVSRNAFNVDVPGVDGLNGTQTYNTNLWRVNASQAIFNYNSWALVQQAKASVKAAHATFNNAAQDLILRTAKAYFDVLFSRDTLNFAEAKKRANQKQLEQAQQRFNVGIDTITSVYEAQAAYDRSIAEVITAQNQQVNQNENLRKLTNHVYDHVAPLRNGTIPLIKPEPLRVEEWEATSLKQNYNLFAARYNLQAARENIKVQSSGSWPTLALQGTSAQTNNYGGGNSNFFVPTNQTISSVALAVNFPIIQGGLVQANTRQAQYNFQTASEQLEQTYRDVVVNSHIAFNTIMEGISKIKADRQTNISQQNSLDSTWAQFQAGTRTMVDVVNAQQKLFEAQEQLASDQYGFINAILHLKYLAGSLNVNDLEEVNSWLATTRLNGPLPQPNPRLKR
ncbi:MAG: TolC family outer membrane protein [Legionellales bacterium]|nr:TolC family outer membrane protein [Legionellales bacterium]